jgi:hypothetical protein
MWSSTLFRSPSNAAGRLALPALAAAVLFSYSTVTRANTNDDKNDSGKPAAAAATAEEVQQLRDQLRDATKKIEQLTVIVDQLQQRLQPAAPAAETAAAPVAPAAQREMPAAGAQDTDKKDKPSTVDQLIAPKSEGGQFAGSEGLYKSDRLKIGGYVDFRYQGPGLDDGVEIREEVDGLNEGLTDSTNFRRSGFSAPRVVLGVASAITDKLLFNSEIEYEFAGDEVEVEQGYLEYRAHRALNLRGGIIVMPLGRFNLYHDSNLQDIVPRPLTSTLVIPSTYSDVGVGAYGEFKLGENARLGYEAYVVNGLRSDEEAEIAREAGFAESKGLNKLVDNNAQKAFVGRLTFSPFIGLELGGSGYRGKHDNNGFYDLSIWAADFKYQYQGFQVLGEYARTAMERAPESAEEIAARDFLLALPEGDYANTFEFLDETINEPLFDTPARSTDGFYVEARYRFTPKWLTKHFEEDASIAPVFRFDQVNLDRSFPNFRFPLNQRRASFGFSLRPTEAVSLNIAYHVTRKPDVFLRLTDGRPFPPYFTTIDANSFSMGLVWAF